jgi:hypothetical protein
MTDAAHPIRFAPDVVLRTTGDEALLLKLGHETAFVLNATAARVAALIADGLPIAEVVDRLAAEYGCSREDVAPDVRELVATLHNKGLLIAEEQA